MREVCRSPILFIVNSFNAKSEPSLSSGDNGATGRATHSSNNKGWILHCVYEETFVEKFGAY